MGARCAGRFTFSLPQLLAAGVALPVLSAAARGCCTPLPTATLVQPAAPRRGAVDAGPWQRPSAARLRCRGGRPGAVLAEGRGRLDTATVRVLEQNLHVIDQAIEEARRAVAAD